MQRLLRLLCALTWLAVPPLALTLSACGSTTSISATANVTPRNLPDVRDVVPDPEERPVPREGEDLGVLADRFKNYGDANAALLLQGQQNYQTIVDRLAHPQEPPP